MDKNRVLHLVLILVVLLLILFLFKLKTGRDEVSPVVRPMERPQALASIPAKKSQLDQSEPAATIGETDFVFPAPGDRLYSPIPRVWERPTMEMDLSQGDIEVEAAPALPLRKIQITLQPTTVVLPWVFSLP